LSTPIFKKKNCFVIDRRKKNPEKEKKSTGACSCPNEKKSQVVFFCDHRHERQHDSEFCRKKRFKKTWFVNEAPHTLLRLN